MIYVIMCGGYIVAVIPDRRVTHRQTDGYHRVRADYFIPAMRDLDNVHGSLSVT